MNDLKAISLIIFVISILLLPISLFADPPLPTPIARVVWVKGTMKAVMANNEVRILQKTSVVYLHDTIITDGHSEGQVVFTDKSLMTFRPNTKMYIDQYAYQPGSKKTSAIKFVVNLIEGGFRTITGLIAKEAPEHYQVNTPVATIGVRGTEYQVAYVNGELYVGYYKGIPCVRKKVKKKNVEVCLSDGVRYVKATAGDVAPVPLDQRPDVFAEELVILPASISPFTPQGAPSRGGFCITN